MVHTGTYKKIYSTKLNCNYFKFIYNTLKIKIIERVIFFIKTLKSITKIIIKLDDKNTQLDDVFSI